MASAAWPFTRIDKVEGGSSGLRRGSALPKRPGASACDGSRTRRTGSDNVFSVVSGEACSIVYNHERGDMPYEFVWWSSTPQSSQGEFETFGLASHDEEGGVHLISMRTRAAGGYR